MGKLIFVRHGESEANRDRIFAEEETPLTELGRQQASETGRAIANRYSPAAVVSSRLRRARETAEIIAAELKLPVEIWTGLEEQDFGDFKGRSFESFRENNRRNPGTYPAEAPWTWVPPAGESTEQTQRRVLDALAGLRARHADEEAVVVCHGMVMLSLWAHWQGTWKGADVPPNCAVVEVEHTPEGFGAPLLLDNCVEP